MFDPSKFTVAKARALPVILLLDNSGSMDGEKITELNRAVNEMIATFRKEAQAETDIQISIISFGASVELALKLTSVLEISKTSLAANGSTPMGTALRMAKEMIEDKAIIPSSGYRPTVVLISDGEPTDSWEGPMSAFVSSGRSSKCDRYAMAIGPDARTDVLSRFLSGTEHAVMTSSDASSIVKFFRFVTMSVSSRSRSADPNKLLPAPASTQSSLLQAIEDLDI